MRGPIFVDCLQVHVNVISYILLYVEKKTWLYSPINFFVEFVNSWMRYVNTIRLVTQKVAGSNPAVVTWMLWVVHLNKAIYLHCLRPNLRNNKENVLQIQKKIYFIIHIYMYLFLATNSLLYWLKKKITKNIKCVLWISWLFHQHDHTQTEFFPILTWPLIYSLSTAGITCNLLWLFDGVKQVGVLEACSIVCIFRGKPKNHKSHLLKLITNQRYISFIYQHWNKVFQDDFMLMNNRSRTQFTKEPMLIKICTST